MHEHIGVMETKSLLVRDSDRHTHLAAHCLFRHHHQQSYARLTRWGDDDDHVQVPGVVAPPSHHHPQGPEGAEALAGHGELVNTPTAEGLLAGTGERLLPAAVEVAQHVDVDVSIRTSAPVT